MSRSHKEPELEITIDDNGKMTVVVKGIKGPACKNIGDWLHRYGKTLIDEFTKEYFEDEYARISQKDKIKIGA